MEDAARRTGFEVKVPFTPGRVDASQNQIDVLQSHRAFCRITFHLSVFPYKQDIAGFSLCYGRA